MKNTMVGILSFFVLFSVEIGYAQKRKIASNSFTYKKNHFHPQVNEKSANFFQELLRYHRERFFRHFSNGSRLIDAEIDASVANFHSDLTRLGGVISTDPNQLAHILSLNLLTEARALALVILAKKDKIDTLDTYQNTAVALDIHIPSPQEKIDELHHEVKSHFINLALALHIRPETLEARINELALIQESFHNDAFAVGLNFIENPETKLETDIHPLPWISVVHAKTLVNAPQIFLNRLDQVAQGQKGLNRSPRAYLEGFLDYSNLKSDQSLSILIQKAFVDRWKLEGPFLNSR